MDDPALGVQVVESEADVDEHLPNEIVDQLLPVLLLYVR